jgi:branched-chain amino acid transport system substrate-binding protein
MLVVISSVPSGAERFASEAQEVPIGYFGPSSPAHPQGGDLWCAASMAVEEGNAAGGYQGIPFRLKASWSANPWGTGVADVTRLAYVEKVRAIIGGIDGATTHLAEQVVAKAQLVLMNPVATDKSIHMAGVPWMFTSIPLDDVHAKVLAEAIASEVRDQPFVVVSATDHDSHAFTDELLKALQARTLAPTFHFEWDPSQPDVHGVLDRARRGAPAALVLVADADDSVRLLTELRAQGYKGALFGGPWMGRRAFVTRARVAAEGVTFPSSLMPTPQFEAFAKRFAERFGRRPDYAAAHTYDTVSMLVAAIRDAGSDRTAIRDALRALAPWSGVAGPVRWDAAGANSRPVHLATIEKGTVHPIGAPRAQAGD